MDSKIEEIHREVTRNIKSFIYVDSDYDTANDTGIDIDTFLPYDTVIFKDMNPQEHMHHSTIPTHVELCFNISTDLVGGPIKYKHLVDAFVTIVLESWRNGAIHDFHVIKASDTSIKIGYAENTDTDTDDDTDYTNDCDDSDADEWSPFNNIFV